jgi:D-alanyl-lipoteichoic acid acyltransferase DltB (MBOAT superfamily)
LIRLFEILLLACAALVIGLIPRLKVRNALLLAASIFIVFWFQSRSVGLNRITFWLPFATILLAVLAWALTASPGIRSLSGNWPGVVVIGGSLLAIALIRYLGLYKIISSVISVPGLEKVLPALGLAAALLWLVLRYQRLRWYLLSLLLVLLIVIFIFMKTPTLGVVLYRWLGQATGSQLADNGAISWLGFSYFAFRILHTIRDRQNGLLPDVALDEYVTYVIFFPALSAGPIDRLERFVGDLRMQKPLTDEDWLFAGKRLLVGLFKTFVLAGALSSFALTPELAARARSAGWMWLMLYAYSFQLYFDFSGYTDIAIGTARLAGIRLPENFNAPYLKPNLTLFWNNWHMTLTQWFRAYFFNPLQRFFRTSRWKLPPVLLLFGLQVSTMVLIGLWHGMTMNFVAWGLWHGAGLFVHNRWRETAGRRVSEWASGRIRKRLVETAGILLTFHYVTFGWVFFLLPAGQLPAALHLLIRSGWK